MTHRRMHRRTTLVVKSLLQQKTAENRMASVQMKNRFSIDYSKVHL